MNQKQRFVDEPRQKFVDEAKTAAVKGLPEENRRFLDLCSLANTFIDHAYTRADLFLNKISRAYRQAWENHNAVLREAEAEEKLEASRILEYALALLPFRIPAMIAQLITDAMLRRHVGKYLADGVERLVETTAQRGLEVVNAILVTRSLRPSSARPEDWQADMEAQILEEKEFVLRLLLSWQTSVNNRDPDFRVDFDPFQRIKDALRIAGQPLDHLPEVDVQQQADSFESGFWAAWLREYSYWTTTFQSAGGSIGGGSRWSYVLPEIAEVRLNVPAPIARRVRELRLDPSPYLREARARAIEEARSRGYRVVSNELEPYAL